MGSLFYLAIFIGMIKLKDILSKILTESNEESVLNRKGQWELFTSGGKALGVATNLIELIKIAYKQTTMGSFVNSKSDVDRSFYWEVIDVDTDPEADVCVFGRKSRGEEKWQGVKIQGIGHDGERISKDKAITKLVELLKKSGFWIEASDALEHILRRTSVRICTEDEVKQLFPGGIDEYHSDGSYTRTIENGKQITETSFGNPRL